MTVEQDWGSSKLEDYLLSATWKAEDAMYILCGRDHLNNCKPLDIKAFNFFMVSEMELGETNIPCKEADRLKEIWEREFEEVKAAQHSPAFFIEWAISKKHSPAWLDWAIRNSFYTPKKVVKPTAQPEANMPENSDPQSVKWRKAFNYQSDGLRALYDMIEQNYFDEHDNPIYDPELLPLKKSVQSEKLKGRTKDEADTIITSSKRKGNAQK